MQNRQSPAFLMSGVHPDVASPPSNAAHPSALLNSIAEAVETPEQWNCFRRIGSAEFQAFLFSRPVPLDELTPILHRRSGVCAADLDLKAANGLMDLGITHPPMQFTEGTIEAH